LKSWADQPTAIVLVSFYAMLMRVPDLHLADAYVRKPFAAAELLAQVTVARNRIHPSLPVRDRRHALSPLISAYGEVLSAVG
jgi:DNA-binding response OmpR family regulator